MYPPVGERGDVGGGGDGGELPRDVLAQLPGGPRPHGHRARLAPRPGGAEQRAGGVQRGHGDCGGCDGY